MKMFWFGRNWKNYVRNVVTEEIIEEAKKSLTRYVPDEVDPEEFFRDKVFVDVGCGSGLFSFSALLLGCKRVISFDIQKESIEALEMVKTRFKHLLPDGAEWQ